MSILKSYLYEGMLLLAFIDHFNISLIIPLLNNYFYKCGISNFYIGILWSIYGIFQMISSPIIGKLSDIMPRLLILSICLFGAGISYWMLSLSFNNFYIILISRILSGIFKHSRSLCKSIIATNIKDINQKPQLYNDKIENTSILNQLATLNVVSNLGFVLGPILAGYIYQLYNDFIYVLYIACSGYFINCALALYLYSGSVSSFSPAIHSFHINLYSLLETFKSLIKLTSQIYRNLLLNLSFNTSFRSLMIVRLALVSAVLVFRHDLYRQLDISDFSRFEIGLIFSASSAFSTLASLLAVLLTSQIMGDYLVLGRNSIKFSTQSIYKITASAYTISMLYTSFWFLAPSFDLPEKIPLGYVQFLWSSFNYPLIWKACIVTGILANSLCNSWCRTLLDEMSIRYVNQHQKKCPKENSNSQMDMGELIGIGQSVSSLSRVLSPFIAGSAQSLISFHSPLYIGGLLAMLGTYTLIKEF